MQIAVCYRSLRSMFFFEMYCGHVVLLLVRSLCHRVWTWGKPLAHTCLCHWEVLFGTCKGVDGDNLKLGRYT